MKSFFYKVRIDATPISRVVQGIVFAECFSDSIRNLEKYYNNIIEILYLTVIENAPVLEIDNEIINILTKE